MLVLWTWFSTSNEQLCPVWQASLMQLGHLAVQFCCHLGNGRLSDDAWVFGLEMVQPSTVMVWVLGFERGSTV